MTPSCQPAPDRVCADYPAAHSTDTWWFAVDRDGHVAFFDSGEEGCVPNQVYELGEGDGLEELSAYADPREPGELLLDPRGFVLPGPLAEVPHRTAEQCAGSGCLMFLSALAAASEELSTGQAEPRPTVSAPAVLFSALTPAQYRRLHDGGACLGCVQAPPWIGPKADLCDENEMPARYGFFQYEHPMWECSGPYALSAHPRQPVKLDALPPSLQRLASVVRFDALCFAETPYLQPAEHFNCGGWMPVVLSSDGKTLRPREGDTCEGDFGELVEKGVQIVHQALVFPDPPKPPPRAPSPATPAPAGFAEWLKKLLGK